MKYFHTSSLDEGGSLLSPQACSIQTIQVYNSSPSQLSYIKLFISDSTPSYSSDSPGLSFAVPGGASISIELGGVGLPPCFIQASRDVAGDTAPATPLHVTVIYAVR